jgi:hypothetical protein
MSITAEQDSFLALVRELRAMGADAVSADGMSVHFPPTAPSMTAEPIAEPEKPMMRRVSMNEDEQAELQRLRDTVARAEELGFDL